MAYQSSDPRRRRRRKKKNSGSSLIIILLAVLMAVLIGFSILLRSLLSSPAPAPAETSAPVTEATEPAPTEKASFWSRLFGPKETEPEVTEPEPEHVVSTATIVATGDILMHKPVFNAGLWSDGSYDLNFIFKYAAPYLQQADYAVANLETTLCGTGNGFPYQGYPSFNCPDEIVDAAKNAGIDMLLTANNHCYDTGEVGFQRTIRTVRERGLTALGTMTDASDAKYVIQNINGIKVGMICYTYEGLPENPQDGVVYLNQNAMTGGGADRINSFRYDNLNAFYEELEGYLKTMRATGAEATVVFIHWGTEYQTVPNDEQRLIAQRLADMNVDVIVGGHPHVIQPIDLLTSRSDPEHRTVCLYSMGNAVSNQRREEMNLNTGHTEDGLLFSFTFSKYSDNTVWLYSVSILPCWVDMRTEGGKEYNIIPLDESLRTEWKTVFELSEAGYSDAVASLERTNAIVGPGLTRVQDYLAAEREQREADYLAAVTATDEAA